MRPKVSIITASYNSEQFIEETIRSVVNHSYADIEYIIIDGGSNDRTLEIVEFYKKYISKVISEKDNGIYDAFNKGVRSSTGDILYFLGSDDYLADSEVIKDVANYFVQTKADLVYGNVYLNEKPAGSPPFRKIGRLYSLEDFKRGHMPHHAGVFTRREMFNKVGLFDTKYGIAGDFDLVLRCFLDSLHNIHYFNRGINIFRDGGVSSHIKSKRITLSETYEIVNKYFGIDLSPTIPNILVNEYYKRWLTHSIITQRNISSVLEKTGVQKVAVFGTLHLSDILVSALRNQGIIVPILLDNDSERQGYEINDLKIVSPEWLLQNPEQYNAVLIAIESDGDQAVKLQLEQMLKNERKTVMTWKDLVDLFLESD
jgi:glycosyltransferase involved in cell wall biosynthesis